jgi:hypothetical protein
MDGYHGQVAYKQLACENCVIRRGNWAGAPTEQKYRQIADAAKAAAAARTVDPVA